MEDKLFGLIEKIYSELIQFKEDTNKRFDTVDERFDTVDERFDTVDERFDTVDERFDTVDERFGGIENDITGIKQSINKINMTIEHDLMPKIIVLFDGHVQNTKQLERIANAVDRHEDIIIRKVK